MRQVSRFRYWIIALFLLAVHYPWAFFFIHFANRQGANPWDSNYKLWCQWDCAHYAKLSTSYTIQDVSFFPLFPLVVRFFRVWLPSLSAEGAAVWTSVVFTLIATYLLLVLGRKLWPVGKESQGGLRFPPQAFGLAFAVSLYPFSQFWFYGYTESFFAILYIGVLLSVFSGRWLAGSALAGLAAITRPQGVWLLGFYLVFFLLWNQQRFKKSKITTAGIVSVIAAGVAPFLVFMLWQWSQSSDPLHFMKLEQQGWGRKLGLLHGLEQHIPFIHGSFIWLALSWAAAYRFIRRRELHWQFLGWATLILAELPLFVGGYYSYARFMSTNLGIFIWAVEILSGRTWAIMTVTLWAVTRLSSEVMNWLTGIWSN